MLRLLLLADTAIDADRVQQVLRQSQQSHELIWTQTSAEFRDAFTSSAIDLSLVDYSLPDWNAPEALTWVRQHAPECPAVLICEPAEEDAAIELLNRGVTDYVLKQRLERLVPVVQRALREAEERRKRHRAERLLLEQQRVLEQIVTGHPLDDCLAAVCAAVARLNPSIRACFLLCDHQRQTFPRSITPDLPPSFGAGLKDAPINDLCIGTCGEAVYRGEPITCADIANDLRWSAEWRHLCLAHGILACHSHPVLGVDGLPLGSLILCFDAARLPTEWEYQLADFGTQIASIAFERNRSIQALQESESRWQELAAASPSAIYTLVEDAAGSIHFEYLSPAFESIHEVSVAAALQNARIVFDQMHPDDRESYRRAIEHSIATLQPFQHEWRILTPSGKLKWLQSNSRPQRRGEHTVWHGIVQEITERKQAEDQLQQREAELKEAQRLGKFGSWQWDAQTDVTTGSDELLRIYGFDPAIDTMPNFNDQNGWLYPHESWQRIYEGVQRALETGIGYELDVRAFRNGTPIWVTTRSEVVRDADGRLVGLRGTVQDITERKQAEFALQDSERRFRRLVESNLFGVAFGDFGGGIHYANQYFLNLIGYTREEVEAGQVQWTEITPAEFLPLDENAMIELRTYGVAVPFEKEFIRKDGTRVPILIGSALLQEPYDQPQEIVAFLLDLSERKQAEAAIQQAYAELALQSSQLESVNQELEETLEELQTNEEELRAQNEQLIAARQFAEAEQQRYQDLFNFAPDGYIVTDANGVIQEANRASAALLGYDATAQTLSPLVVYVVESDRWAFRNFLNDLRSHSGPQTCELTLQGFRGRSFPAEITTVAIRNSQEQILGIRWLIRDISERRQAAAALAANEARLRGFVEANVVGILYGDIYGNIHEANDELLRIVGYTREDLQAGRLRWLDITPPEWLPVDNEAIAEARTRGACTPYEKEYIRKDGSRVPVLVGYSLVGDAREESVAFILDLTERKHAEAALRENEDRLRLALESAELGTWDYNPVTGVLKWDDQCKAMFGLPPDAEVNYDLFLAGLHPDDREPTHQATRRALSLESGGEVEIEYRTIGINDGIERWILAKGQAYFNAAGEAVRFIGTALNITEKKRAEAARLRLAEEREQLLVRERAARAEAERANRIKDEFLAIVSHELRTPLNPILGWSTLLLSRTLDPAKTTHALTTIARNAKLQAELIEDLLDVSRILRGKLSLTIVPVNLVSIVEAALETVRLSAEAKGIAVHVVVEQASRTVTEPHSDGAPSRRLAAALPSHSSSPLHVMGDPARLQQVVWNLLSNAVKFTPAAGQVEVRLERGEFSRLSAQSSHPTPPSCAQLTITDTGKGIAPDFLPHVFDYFRQEDGATTRQFGGLGLGLAIVRHLVELHGGTVWAESLGENQGATFKVQLPLMASPDQNPEQPTETNQRSAPPLPFSPAPLTSLCILVVDDDADTRNFVAFLLEQAGATVVTAATASEALVALSHCQPDVLLSDIGMPEMDGYMLMRRIRALPPQQGGTIPAIALTAYAGEIDYRQAMAAGFQQHLAKPIEPQTLLQAIITLCSARDNTTS